MVLAGDSEAVQTRSSGKPKSRTRAPPDSTPGGYDTPHGTAGSTTARLLLEQATEGNVVHLDPVVALGGAWHTALVHTVWPHARTPLAGTRGMGEQMARLAAIREGQARHRG